MKAFNCVVIIGFKKLRNCSIFNQSEPIQAQTNSLFSSKEHLTSTAWISFGTSNFLPLSIFYIFALFSHPLSIFLLYLASISVLKTAPDLYGFFFRFSFFLYSHIWNLKHLLKLYENCSCKQIYSLLFGCVFFGNDDVILSLYLHFLYVHIITFGEFFIEFFSKSINN